MEKSSIPAYQRTGMGEILGISSNLRIDLKDSQGHMLALSRGSRGGKDRPNYKKRLAKKPESLIPKAVLDKDFITQTDVIQLDSNIPESSDSESGDDATVEHSAITLRNMELARATQSNPTNPTVWLKFADFQRDVMKESQKKLNEQASKNLIDLQLSIISKGLDYMPDSPQLLTRYMELTNQSANEKKLADKWAAMLNSHAEVGELWTLYITFQQSSSANSYFTDVLEQFYYCFGELKRIMLNHPEKVGNLERILLHLFRRGLRFLKEAGYTELFFGCYQAMLEYNMFPGDQSRFLAFWDAGEPRIGEKDAMGWTLSSSTAQVPKPDASIDEYTRTLHDDSLDLHVKEAHLDDLARPARVLDASAGNEDDPFRILLSSDIEPYLHTFGEPEQLLWALIQDMGIPLLHPYSVSSTSALTDQYLGLDSVDDDFWPVKRVRDIVQWIEGLAMEPEETVTEMPQFPIKLTAFQDDQCTDISKIPDPKGEFLLNMFQLLSSKLQDEQLISFHLGLVYNHTNDIKAVRKLAKSYLRNITPGLLIYNAFALLEYTAGNSIEANRIWDSVIQSSSSHLDTHYSFLIIMVTTYAQSLIDQGEYRAALEAMYKILYHPDNPSNMSFQLEAYLDRELSRAFSFGRPRIAMQLGELRLMLAYVTSGTPAIFSVLSPLVAEIKERNVTHTADFERLLMRATSILHGNGLRHRVHKASTLREVLQIAVEYFPYNTYFLQTFFANETRMRFQRHLETVLEEYVFERPSHLSWLFGAWMSLHKMDDFAVEASSGIAIARIRQTRAIFERAVAHKDTQHSPLLWRTFIEFEQRIAEDPQRAWDVFLRGATLCSWSKSYLLIGFTLGTDHHTELGQVYRTMIDKGLHVRVEVKDLAIVLPDDPEEEILIDDTGRAHLIEGV